MPRFQFSQNRSNQMVKLTVISYIKNIDTIFCYQILNLAHEELFDILVNNLMSEESAA